LADQAHQQLAHFGSVAADPLESAKTGQQLAQTGYDLYGLLFQPGQEVRAWLERLSREREVQSLEIIGDAFTLPWSVVYDQTPDQALFARAGADGAFWKGFWGRRFNLLGGRRVQWLRGRQLPHKPAVVLAVDPALRASLPQEEQERLSEFQRGPRVVAESCANLVEIFQSQEVDLLYVFGRADGNAVRLGDDRLTAQALENIVFAQADGEGPSGQTLLFLNGCPGEAEKGSGPFCAEHPPGRSGKRGLTPFRPGEPGNMLKAFERFSGFGLIGTVQPVAAPLANQCGLELLSQFLDGGQTLAEALTAMRQRHPVAGSLYFASCPGDVRAGGPSSSLRPDADLLPLPDEPYQPLVPLREDTASLLVGREADTAQVAGLLDDGDTRLVLVHGMPGVGKASLLHAAVVPYLEDHSVGYQFLRERGEGEPADNERDYPVLPIRATSDLAGQLAIALLECCGRPYSYVTPTGQTVTVDLPAILSGMVKETQGAAASLPATDELRRALLHDPALFSRVLEAITAQLPFELVLLIEQGEELFSLIRPEVEPRAAEEALAILRAALLGQARAKFIVSLRTAYLGRFLDRLLHAPEEGRCVRTFLVRELTEEELVEVIQQPTSQEPLPGTDEVPQEKYAFLFEQGLADDIAKEARRLGGLNQESPLTLIHAVCSRLFKLACRQEDRAVRAAHLKKIGGVEKGLAKYVADLVKTTTSQSDRQAFQGLLQKLFIRQPDGSLTRDLVFEDDLKSEWRGSTPLEELVAETASQDIRLLDVSYLNIGGKEGNFVSLAHDALAPVAAQQADEASKRSYGWSRMFDGLWITVPLLLLLGVFAWTRIRASSNALDDMQDKLKTASELNAQAQKELAPLEGMRWPSYLGQLHAADQAIQAGDLVRARQALISVKPTSTKAQEDLRGFEWFYLWQQMHQDQATLYGHRGTVTSVALTPDGLALATTCPDGSVRLWNVWPGQNAPPTHLAQLELKDKNSLAAGQCVAFSPGGSLLAAGGDDGVVRVWKVERASVNFAPTVARWVASLLSTPAGLLSPPGQLAVRDSVVPYSELRDHEGAVLGLGFSPDGTTLASAGNDGTVKLWDHTAAAPKVTATLKEHAGAVLAVAYSPNGKLLASAGADKKAVIWDTAKSSKVAVLEGHPQEVNSVAWSLDGKTLATAGAQTVNLLDTGIIKLWDTATWKERQTPPIRLVLAPVFAVSFTDDGTTLVTASQDNAVQLWDIATGKERFALRGHLGWVRSLAVARGTGRQTVIASGSYDGTAKVWLPLQQEGDKGSAPTRDLLKVSSEPVCAVVFSPDDRWLATGSGDGIVKLWNAATGEETKALKGHKGAVLALAWAANGKWLVSGGADGELKLWDVDPASKTFASEVDSVAGHAKEVTCLDWPVHSNRFASGSLDGTARVWKVEAGKFGKEETIITTESAVLCLVFNEQIDFLATGHDDAKARLWNAQTGKAFNKQPVLAGHTGRVTAISMVLGIVESHPAAWVLTGSADQSIKVWNVQTGINTNTLRGHAGPVTCMAMGRNTSHTLVTGSTDRTIKLWDPMREKERWMFMPRLETIRAAAMSGDSRTIAAAGEDGSVRLYRAGQEETKGK